MGGLFGGGSSKTRKPEQELNPPIDTSGSSIPGDDKMQRQMKADTMQASKKKRAETTLLGRSANENKVGGTMSESKPKVSYA